MIVKKHIQEIELFVAMEDAHEQQIPIVKKREIVKPVVEKKREPKIVEEIITPVEVPVPEEKEPEIAERVKEVILPVPAISRPAPVVDYAPVDSEPVDTEFGAAVAPSFLHREMPVYPTMARKLGREGRVVLRLSIDEKGTLRDVEVVQTAKYGFREAAIEAVKKSTFLPAKKDGKPVASRALLPVRFSLRRN
jgi:periplasmic protein TonB